MTESTHSCVVHEGPYQKTGGKLWRSTCRCGWEGTWKAYPGWCQDEWRRHVEQ